MQYICLLAMELTAVCCDLRSRRIPNPLIAAGLLLGVSWQWSAKGPPGLLEFTLGALLPLILLGVLHYFRMLGAGDVKLLVAVGGVLGPAGSLKCIWLSFLIAAVFSIAVLIKHRILIRRLKYFFQYIQNYFQTKTWIPYIEQTENPAYIHFSIFIFLSTLFILKGFV